MATTKKSGSSLAFSTSYKSRNTPALPWSTGTYYYVNSYDMSTINHGRGPYTKGDTGGPFLLNKSTYRLAPAKHKSSIYEGLVTAGKPSTYTFSSKPLPSNTTQMVTFGTSAVAKVSPTNPAFQGATFMAELREGAPRTIGSGLLKSKARDLRKVGDEYLNVEFGWLPFQTDLKNFLHAVKDHKKILDQYVRDSNQKIRRRYYGPSTGTTRTTSFTNGTAGPAAAGLTGLKGNVTEITSQQKWFSGAFRYHIPLGDSAREKFIRWESEANRLLGTRLTPEVVWNAAPWSWAVDWFTNAGDVIHNISHLGHDGLVMQYGYAMEKSYHSYDVVNIVPGGSCMTSFEEKTLFRIPATPYGFGLTWEGFSPTQVAVTAALGLSKAPG